VKILAIAYAIPITVMVVGAVLRYDAPRELGYVEPPAWKAAVLCAGLVAHIGAFVARVVVLRGARIRAAAVVLPSIWLSLSSGFVAGIAIAGVGP